MIDLMSHEIDKLAEALSKAQGEMTVAGKNQKNPFFKSSYADFEAIVAASRPALAKYGLSIVQSPCVDEGISYLITIMMHSSGQWIKSKAIHNPPKNDIQSLSSYNTYLKRMCYASLVGVTTGDDDDGEASVSHTRQEMPPRVEYINQQETDQLREELDGFTKLEDHIKKQMNMLNLGSLSKKQFPGVLQRIKELKNLPEWQNN